LKIQDSVILIPESEWSLDLATPQLYCTTKDSKCVQLDYMFPIDAIMVEPKPVEGEPRPDYLINPDVKVKHLNDGVNIIDVEGM